MAAQADLHVEAHHLEVLNGNFRRWKHVRFPQPLYACSAVIIETYESGRIVTGVIAMYERLAETLRQAAEDENELPSSLSATLSSLSSVKESKDEDAYAINGRDLIPIDIAKFLVTSGLGLYLKMLLVDNLMHAGMFLFVSELL